MKIHVAFLPPPANYSLVAPIFLSVDDEFFPEENWSDFSVEILGWWVSELIEQLRGRRVGKYLFKDGPYYFEAIFSNEVKVTCKKRTLTAPINVISSNVSKRDFIEKILTSAKEMLKICAENDHMSNEVLVLKNNTVTLLNLVRELDS